jgi:3-oxoacyl-[acyl-carrier protein] reductase
VNLELEGKIALITGGSHGIGLATALALAAEGCNIVICSRDPDRLDSAVDEITTRGVACVGVPTDVMKPKDNENCFSAAIERFGRLDILINNVGGGGRWGSEIVEDTELTVWREVIEKNVMAAVQYTQLAIPAMRKNKWGRVVTVGSRLGKEGGGRPWFTLSKAAEIGLMKTLAMTHYLVRDGITFNTVTPGAIMIPDTGWASLLKSDPESIAKTIDKDLPLNRFGTPEEVASVIVFLCSEKASLVNGATIAVDGGESSSF